MYQPKNKILAVLGVLCLFLSPMSAHAILISFGPTSASGSGPLITFNNLATPTMITGDATVSLTVNGDLNSSHENVLVMLDGLSLGRVLNNITTDDLFNFPNNDRGNQSRSNLTGTATISNAAFAPLIADGLLNLSFQFTNAVNCCGTVNTLSGSIGFTETVTDPVDVPEPGTLALLGLGVAGMGLARRRRQA